MHTFRPSTLLYRDPQAVVLGTTYAATGWDAAAVGLLDDAEVAEARALKGEAARCAFVASRALLRAGLEDVSGVPAKSWRFARDPHGKLHAVGRAVSFSIAHADGAVAVAISDGREVGVDLERIDRADAALAATIARSEEEERELAEMAPAERAARALTLWTRKEAYAKMVGRGTAVDFAAIDTNDKRLASRIVSLGQARYALGVAVEAR